MSYIRFIINYGLYHVFNRGNNKENIFETEQDKIVFLKIVARIQKQYGFVLYGYCLMSNHYHLIFKDVKKNLPEIMGLIQENYAKYYNSKKGRTGQVFENPFKSNPVTGVPHLFTLLCYVANNPLVAGVVNVYSRYHWSSRYQIGFDRFNLVDYTFVDYISKKYNQMPIDEYIMLHSSNGLISAIELQHFDDNEAKLIYNEITLSTIGSKTLDKNTVCKNLRIEIVQRAYYIGLSIRQIKKFSGFSEYFIRMNKDCEKPYI